MTDIETTLAARHGTHGEYLDHADITQRLKDVIRSGRTYGQTSAHERETLDMIAHKIGRIVSGNPHFQDHWHDIAGYAVLSETRNAFAQLASSVPAPDAPDELEQRADPPSPAYEGIERSGTWVSRLEADLNVA